MPLGALPPFAGDITTITASAPRKSTLEATKGDRGDKRREAHAVELLGRYQTEPKTAAGRSEAGH